MKQALLLFLSGLLCSTLWAQQLRPGFRSHGPISSETVNYTKQIGYGIPFQNSPKYPQPTNGSRFVSIIDIGTSGDPFSYGCNGGQKSIVKFNPSSEEIVHIHRMGGILDPEGNPGDIGYDISYDLGETFNNMIEVYQEEENLSANFPQFDFHFLPQRNDDLYWYLSYLSAVPDGSNQPNGFGGYLHGIVPVGEGLDQAQNQILSSDPSENHYKYNPEDVVTTLDSDFWAVDINQDWSSGEMEYTGHILVTHGTWNEDLEQMEFDEFLLACPVAEGIEKPFDAKICFSMTNSSIGYIAVIGNNNELGFCQNALYPIYWKTTNGGQTWSEPHEIQIGGPDGIDILKDEYLLSDNQIEYIYYPPYPTRDEIVYTTAFDLDITVDNINRLHIATGVGIQNTNTPFEIITESGFYSVVDIIVDTTDEVYDAFVIDRPKQFRSDIFPEMTEDNRIQTGVSPDAKCVFISYLDTHLEGETANNYPDIMCRGILNYNYSTYVLTCADSIYQYHFPRATNVTKLSDGMWQSYYMNMSKTVIQEEYYDYTNYIIPFTYCGINPDDPMGPVQFKYIQDFQLSFDNNLCGSNPPPEGYPVNIDEYSPFYVSDNHPNPFSDKTTIELELSQPTIVSLKVYNQTGQMLYEKSTDLLSTGRHKITVSAKDLQKGICLYTINAGEHVISGKMIVQ